MLGGWLGSLHRDVSALLASVSTESHPVPPHGAWAENQKEEGAQFYVCPQTPCCLARAILNEVCRYGNPQVTDGEAKAWRGQLFEAIMSNKWQKCDSNRIGLGLESLCSGARLFSAALPYT